MAVFVIEDDFFWKSSDEELSFFFLVSRLIVFVFASRVNKMQNYEVEVNKTKKKLRSTALNYSTPCLFEIP